MGGQCSRKGAAQEVEGEEEEHELFITKMVC